MEIIEIVTRAQVKLFDMFRFIDKNNDGGLSRDEFIQGLTECGIIDTNSNNRPNARTHDMISIKDAEELWRQSDLNKDKNVTWDEFFEALCVYDTWEGNVPNLSCKANSAIMRREVCTIISRIFL